MHWCEPDISAFVSSMYLCGFSTYLCVTMPTHVTTRDVRVTQYFCFHVNVSITLSCFFVCLFLSAVTYPLLNHRPVASYIRVVEPWKKFSLALLAICFTTTFAIYMQKFTVSTDSNHNCFSKRTFWKRNIGRLLRGGRDLW